MLMIFFVLRLTKFDIGYIIFLKIKHKDIYSIQLEEGSIFDEFITKNYKAFLFNNTT